MMRQKSNPGAFSGLPTAKPEDVGLSSERLARIGQAMQKYTPWLDLVLPWRLLMDVGHKGPLAGYLALGEPLPTVAPIIATVLWCVLFVGVAIWRMRREEF